MALKRANWEQLALFRATLSLKSDVVHGVTANSQSCYSTMQTLKSYFSRNICAISLFSFLLPFIFSLIQRDVLVQWEKDKSKNVVSIKDLSSPGKLRKGSMVSMKWQGSTWIGHVLEIDNDSSGSESDSGDSSDPDADVPLARLLPKKTAGNFESISTMIIIKSCILCTAYSMNQYGENANCVENHVCSSVHFLGNKRKGKLCS